MNSGGIPHPNSSFCGIPENKVMSLAEVKMSVDTSGEIYKIGGKVNLLTFLNTNKLTSKGNNHISKTKLSEKKCLITSK